MTAEEEHRIRERAYFMWEQEGRPRGRELDHRLRAEAEIAGERLRGSITALTDTAPDANIPPPVIAQAQTVTRVSTIERKRDRNASAKLAAMIASASPVRAKRRKLSLHRK